MPRKISHEAQRAFDEEVYPRIIASIMEQAKREIGETMYEISQGKYPDKGIQYSVERHRPMKMKADEFTDEIMEAFIEWTQGRF